MSSNPQWKSFQPPSLNDASIIDFKPMNLGSNSPGPNYRNTNGIGYPSSNQFQTPDSIKDMANNLFTSQNNYSNYMYSNNSPTIGRFPIGTFTGNEANEIFNGSDSMQSPSSNSFNMSNVSNSSYNNDSNFSNQGTRETGIIEKLLHSYGFIQCCERQARLFFHFSQFSGNIEHLKIGDPVEFEMTYDRRTGKPIASLVSKIAPEVVLSEERVTGTVTTELKSEGASGGETQGRISYENRGECFFLPYTKDDVEGNVTLRVGDKVSFQIATNPRGNLGATHVRLENPAHPVKYQGVVCSIKDNFGFIERADIVKEIFFHYSEVQAKECLQVGDDVEFIIQTKKGKEVACNITHLPAGTVVFEDVCETIVKGQVQKPVERNRGQTPAAVVDPLPGKIRYRAPDHSEVEVPFGEKDQRGEYTLRHGDWVQFNIATDRRDQLQRATNISLLPESFTVSGERRELGAVAAIKDCFGFIRCADRDARLYFHFFELLNYDSTPSIGDEVEFTVIQDPCSSFGNQRQSAIRIKTLPPGTVQFETVIEKGVSGVVSKEPPSSWHSRSPTKNQMSNGEKTPETGLITYTSNGIKKTITFSLKDCHHKSHPKVGDKVDFNICQVKRNKELMAVDVVIDKSPQNQIDISTNGSIMTPTITPAQQVKNGYIQGQPLRGYIAALKDAFGFIEAANLDKEIFFHFSNFEGDTSKLEIGSEVEYTVVNSIRGNVPCVCGEQVILLPKGSVHPNVSISDEIRIGTVVRPLRSVNRDQPQYAGLIKSNPHTDGDDSAEYEFGISGLANKRELLQPGDTVEFQISSDSRAVNISAIRKKNRSTVESIKGQFGFLAFEPEEGKKLFFHVTEVKDGAVLQPGDTVEFVVVTNQRTGKSFACSISKITEKLERPERLISRLRTISVDEGPRLVIVRQPRGPDEEGNAGNKGFSPDARRQRSPGQLLD